MEMHYILLAVAILAGLWYYFYVFRKSSGAGAPADSPAAPVEEQYAEEEYAEEEYVEEEYEDDDPKEKSK
jgi:flagellar basal body-associated protein FliL